MKKLEEIVAGFEKAVVGVVGDIVADVYILGHPDRLSREAPVVIVRYEEEKLIPGCAANTMNNLLALGCTVKPVAVVGDDDHGRRLLAHFKERVSGEGLIRCSGLRTVCKTRILVGEPNRTKQQVIRIDYEHQEEAPRGVEEQVLEAIDRIDARVDAWLVSDYDYFVITPRVASRLVELSRAKPLIVDSRYRSFLFKGATCFTPNEGEAMELSGLKTRDDAGIEAMGKKLFAELEARSLIITRGNHGMTVFEGDEVTAIPTVGDDEVVDVSGAGDTVSATVAASLVAGAGTLEAARLASCAAGVVVMKTGAATCSAPELMDRIPLLSL
jgi:rfaE bifunctional protein kinase chain/domain